MQCDARAHQRQVAGHSLAAMPRADHGVVVCDGHFYPPLRGMSELANGEFVIR
jgi:hypothetical protein